MAIPPSNLSLSDSPRYLEKLRQAAALWEMEPEFWDIWGRHHVPGPEVQQAILTALGVDCGSVASLTAAIAAREEEDWLRALPPTLVVARETPLPLRLRLASTDAVTVEVQTEDGAVWRELVQPEETGEQRTVDGRVVYEVQVALTTAVPLGYHHIRVLDAGHVVGEARLIVAPVEAYLPAELEAGGRAAGVAVSLYGVRSERNWGCGDLTDLRGLVGWMADMHASFLALNPLHAIENRQPYNISPYLPNSSFFRNPIYLDVEAVPEYAASQLAQSLRGRESVQREIAACRDAEFVEYERVWRLKRLFLQVLHRQFRLRASAARRQAFAAFVAERGERLRRFATYCALWDRLHKRNRDLWIWPDWPAEYQDPESAAVAEFVRTHGWQIEFHQYVQWVLDEELGAVQQEAREKGLIGLYHDLALATDRCGADLWAYRPLYVAGCRVGSPPDGFSPEGQDWAFPPPNARKLREDGYRFFIDSIRANSRHGGALRMDHVMRLFRLYWIPDGLPAKQGAYVRDFAEDLLHILALESHRGKFFLVGEDLGTVEDRVRKSLDRHRILGCKVLFFEKHPDGRFRKPAEYDRHALVSSTTHDLATLAGFWTNRDIEARRNAGLLPDGESYQRQIAERVADKQALLDVLHELGLLPAGFARRASDLPELTGELHNAIIGFLVRTPSIVMVLNQEDLTKETEQQNLPGSTWQYPNWKRKMRYTVEQLRGDRVALDFAQMFRNWLDASGRRLR
ncbi:MAG: 4-alpha-glucanotransferase [Acidobacteria bacterium]|nr:4-alpha-glucanotransferase [Acidobacteriota bacterium]